MKFRKFFQSKKSSWIILGLLMFLVIILGARKASSFKVSGGQKGLHVHFFDIGQGDATLLVAPDGSDILIDGGPDGKILEYLGRALPPIDRTIELMVLTHPHADHMVGLIEVLKHYKVEALMMTGVNHGSAAYKTMLKKVKEEDVQIIYPKKDYSITYGGMELRVLSPKEDWKGKNPVRDSQSEEGDGLNETSIVLLIDYQDTELLLMGDAVAQTEKEIMEKTDIKADILKVGHHGSKYSTSAELLNEVNPRYAIISSGAGNRYGHPHYRILRALSIRGIKIFRTDLDGSIEVFGDVGEPVVYRASAPPSCLKTNFMLKFLSIWHYKKLSCS